MTTIILCDRDFKICVPLPTCEMFQATGTCRYQMEEKHIVKKSVESIIDNNAWKLCPVNLNSMNKKACKETVAGTAICDQCGHVMCPVCGRHNVEQLSRVTGYISTVSGWNDSKKQEFKDRKRYDIGGKL